jgi:moderate conductance mechanosensitive channel
VEQVTLRYLQPCDYDGYVHFVANGMISSVANLGHGHAQAVIDVGVAYGADIDLAMSVMRNVAAKMQHDPVHDAHPRRLTKKRGTRFRSGPRQ